MSGRGRASCSGNRPVAVLEAAIDGGVAADTLSLVFAGGIHDARSAATGRRAGGRPGVRGVKIGILMGTAYLFTREAVTTGAIVPRFQDEALRCRRDRAAGNGAGPPGPRQSARHS